MASAQRSGAARARLSQALRRSLHSMDATAVHAMMNGVHKPASGKRPPLFDLNMALKRKHPKLVFLMQVEFQQTF